MDVKLPDNGVASTCSILSVVFGSIAFCLLPPVFGLAGLILGVVGICLSKEKTVPIIGVSLSVTGAIGGMILGYYGHALMLR
jgi:hypothetical protein